MKLDFSMSHSDERSISEEISPGTAAGDDDDNENSVTRQNDDNGDKVRCKSLPSTVKRIK